MRGRRPGAGGGGRGRGTRRGRRRSQTVGSPSPSPSYCGCNGAGELAVRELGHRVDGGLAEPAAAGAGAVLVAREEEVLQLALPAPSAGVVGLEEERMWRRLETSSTQTSTTGIILAAITDAMVVGEEAVREWTAKIHQG